MLLLLYGRGRYYTSSKRIHNLQVNTGKEEAEKTIAYVSQEESNQEVVKDWASLFWTLFWLRF